MELITGERGTKPRSFLLTTSHPFDKGSKGKGRETMEDNRVNVDDEGFINETYYLNACIDIIDRGLKDRGVDPVHITTNQLKPFLNDCYDALFKPSKRNPTFEPNTTIPYNETNIQRLINVYLKICDRYNALPSVYVFSRFTGVGEERVGQYVTNGREIIGKHRKTYVQDRLNDSTIGVIALANNDIDTGLLYTRQNIVDHATVKKALSFSDLQQIADKNGGAMAQNDISGHLKQGEKVEEMP